MVGTTGTDGSHLVSDVVLQGKLCPAEVHDAIRQRLVELAVSWGLNPADAYQLSRQLHRQSYLPGEIILPYRARADFLGLIVRGQVGVYKGRHRAERPLAVLLPGSSFGEITPGEVQPRQTIVQALSRCEVLFLRRADVKALARGRRQEQRVAALWRTLAWVTLAVAVFLISFLILGLPQARKVIALVPMGLGQWCGQQGPAYGHCAELAWQAAAKLAPDDANPLLALGSFYFEQGLMAEAERSFEAAKAVAPDWGAVYNNLGLIYAERGQHGRAVAAFQHALDLEPGAFAPEHNLGSSLQAMHAYQEAVMHYERALAFGEPQANTLVNLAIGYYEVGKLDEAAEAARQALRHDKGMAPAHVLLGAVALASQQPEAALPHLRRAMALDSGNSQAQLYLGLVYQALGRPAEAVSAFEQALATTEDAATRDRIRRHLGELNGAEEKAP